MKAKAYPTAMTMAINIPFFGKVRFAIMAIKERVVAAIHSVLMSAFI